MAIDMRPVARGPGESADLEPGTRPFLWERVECLREPDGTLWVTAHVAAELLGYASPRAFLNVTATPSIKPEVDPYTLRTTVVTKGQPRRVALFREAALYVVGQHMTGARGADVRKRLAELAEAEAKRERTRERRHVLADARSDHPAVLAGAVLDDASERLEPIARVAGGEVAEAIDDVRRLLEEHRTVIEVAGQGVLAVAHQNRKPVWRDE